LGEISSGNSNSNSRSLGNKGSRVGHILTVTKGNLFRVLAILNRDGIDLL
jgi:hypothetical protein